MEPRRPWWAKWRAWAGLPGHLWALAGAAQQQRAVTTHLLAELQQGLPPDGTLGRRERYRLGAYPFQFVGLFAQPWARLQGRRLGPGEQARLTLLAMAASLLDDFMDAPGYSPQALEVLCCQAARFPAQTAKEQLYQRLLARLGPGPTPIFAQHQRGYLAAELAGRALATAHRQGQPFAREVLLAQALAKAGHALCLCRLMMDPPAPAAELTVVYQLGQWVQVLDDLLDLGPDQAAHLPTLATTAPTLAVLATELGQYSQLAWAGIRTLPFAPARREALVLHFRLLAASGWVYLSHLQQLSPLPARWCPGAHPPARLRWRERRFRYFWQYPLALWRQTG
jgi:hypothetical protein